MTKGVPVVIAANGLGFPVKPVDSGAPLMTVADNGLGSPIVISDRGAPFIVDGYTPPEPPIIPQPFTMLAGTIGQQTGYYPPSVGSISGEPLPQFPVLGIVSNGINVQIILSGDCVIYLQGTTPIFSGFDLGEKVGDWEYISGEWTVCTFTTTDVFVDGASYDVTWVWDS